MKLNYYQESTAKTAKTFKPRKYSPEQVRVLVDAFKVAWANSKFAGIVKKNIFHGHDKFISDSDIQNMENFYGYSGIDLKRVYEVAVTPQDQILIEGVLGAVDEIGELGELAAKYLNQQISREEFIAGLKDELGDVMWYNSRIATGLEVPLADIAQANLNKLAARYPQGFSEEASKNRDTEAEKAAQNQVNNTSNKDVELVLKNTLATLDATIFKDGKVSLKAGEALITKLQNMYDEIKKTVGE